MIKTISEHDFRSEFQKMARNKFTYDGLGALFNYLDELDYDNSDEFDVIGICCNFTEYESFEEFQGDYSNLNIERVEDINKHTTLIAIENSDSFIIEQF